jgi:hypothetical protein
MINRAGAAFVRLQTPANFEGSPSMKAPIYLLAAVTLLAASCSDSGSKGPELLFAQTSDGAVFTDSTLRLTGISPNTGWFTDRPYREAGQIPTEEFLTLWDEGGNSFADDPPNADFTCTVAGEVVNYVVELQNPRVVITGCNWEVCVPYYLLDYDVVLIGSDAFEEGGHIECDGPAHLFIDISDHDSFSTSEDCRLLSWLPPGSCQS